jgi:glutathione S-transferase
MTKVFHCRLEVSRSHRILWLLEELQIPYELKTYKRTEQKLADPALRQIHPIGKSPVVTVEVPGRTQPLVLAESAAIAEYLCDYYGKGLVPNRYQDGMEGKIGLETEAWLRYRYFMHYAEGSIMPLMLISIVMKNIKDGPVPFFIKPITNAIVGKVTSIFLAPNFKTHYTFLEDQLKTAPDGGEFLCGKDLTAADIMMSFPLEAGQSRSGMSQADCPLLWAYVDRLHQREAYKRSVQKIAEVEGSFKMNL